ncbi:MAG: hypothetical protein JOY51_03125 [Nevskia sp.]|nr:hypothetical protein [Nevskia sp.]
MNEFDQRPHSGPQPGGAEPPIPGLDALRRDRTPQRDLWLGIDSRIRAQRVRRSRAPWQAAVGIAASLLVVLSAAVTLQNQGSIHQPLSSANSEVPLPAQPRDNLLLPATARLHPETRALVKANLKIVDSAENQLRRALAADPDGEYLKSLLNTARQQKEQLHVVLADAR